ncbi:ATP-binding protein [Undibacterium parvum]|uniref:histidine kinase n=1 Tax=Undibacterium parvum TaxID=401471 RepID=A0A3S9HQF9_9BURK|nr:ATP-binding protein [Undibacterium parvum]AZP14299.1 sensor histidine kinase [Undibacterium parvum]
MELLAKNRNRDARVGLSLFSLLLLAYIWGSTYYQLLDAKNEAIQTAQKDARNYARTIEEHTIRTLQTADQAALFVSEHYLVSGLRFDLLSYMKSGIILGDILNQVSIVDQKGELALSNLPMKKTNLADREHIRVHMEKDLGQLFVSKPVLGRISQKWSLQMTRRINHADGSFNGVAVVSVDPFYFTRFYDEINLGKHGTVTMFGEDGIVRARRDGKSAEVGQDLSKGMIFKAALANGSGDMRSTSVVDGKERLFSYRKIKNYPLYVAAAIGIEDALAPYQTRKIEALRLSLIASLLIIAFSVFVIAMVGRLQRSEQHALSANAAKTSLLHDLELQKDELKASSDRLDTIVQNAADAIITTNDRGDIESFNHSAESIFACSAKDLLGRNMQQLTPTLQAGSWKLLEAGVLGVVEGVRNGGAVFPLEITTSKVHVLGQDKFILIARDITERRKVERLQQEFVSTVSHELRTPLTAIRGSLGLVAGGVTGVLPVQAATLVKMAYTNTERLTQLINDLLDVQKLESGLLSLTQVSCNLAKLIDEARDVNQAFATRLEVNIALHNPTPDVQVNVDAGRFQQVMANLLSNACKYSNQGDTVMIATKLLASDRIRIAVSDRGPGISEEFRERIFQKFSQQDSSDTKAKGGSGLGLSISKAIVNQMGGEIGYHSTIGEGSSFYVDFPVYSG